MFDKILQLPSPWQILIDPASIIVISIFLALMIAEAVVPGRRLPSVKYWRLRGIAAFIIYFFICYLNLFICYNMVVIYFMLLLIIYYLLLIYLRCLNKYQLKYNILLNHKLNQNLIKENH